MNAICLRTGFKSCLLKYEQGAPYESVIFPILYVSLPPPAGFSCTYPMFCGWAGGWRIFPSHDSKSRPIGELYGSRFSLEYGLE